MKEELISGGWVETTNAQHMDIARKRFEKCIDSEDERREGYYLEKEESEGEEDDGLQRTEESILLAK